MDTVALDFAPIVQKIVEDYADGIWFKASAYAVCDNARHIYAAIVVPDYPRKFQAGLVVMARIIDDKVIIDHDTTDQPLYQELMRNGIPREKIVLAYAGEHAPVSS